MRDITYCLSCKKNTRNINPKVVKSKNNRKMMLSRCSMCNNKKPTFTVGPSSLERISQGSGIFDCLKYNRNRDKIKDALLKPFK